MLESVASSGLLCFYGNQTYLQLNKQMQWPSSSFRMSSINHSCIRIAYNSYGIKSIAQGAEASHAGLDPVVLVAELDLGIGLRHERRAKHGLLVARDLDPGHEVGRVAGGREGPRSGENLVHRTPVDAFGGQRSVLLGKHVDHRHGGEELLGLRINQRLEISVPSRSL